MKNVDTKPYCGEEVAANTLPTQQNKKNSEVGHYKFVFLVNSISDGFYDEVNYICCADSLSCASEYFRVWLQLHEITVFKFIGWCFVSSSYRKISNFDLHIYDVLPDDIPVLPF